MSYYYLFAWSDFHPDGGADDLVGQFDKIDQAKNYFSKNFSRKSVGHIMNSNFDIVERYDRWAIIFPPTHYKPEHWVYEWRNERRKI